MLHEVKKLLFLTLAISLLATVLPEAHAQSNTLVRFRVSFGSTVLGNIDVELFNQDKPVTVSNFLAYVDSGRFKRTFLHRLVPGFVIQGGSWNIINPYSGALFQIMNEMRTDPPIVNEYNAGTVRSNLFGTLAMAKVDGEPNSATSSWFFNLADNSTNLNVQNGGFTVFGRVTSAAGTNLLQKFNTLSTSRGIINMADLNYFLGCGTWSYVQQGTNYMQSEATDTLPVSFLGSFCVRYTDLLMVDVFRLTNAPPDTASPTMVLTTPGANSTVEAADITVSGTAKDNGSVQSVDIILNHERLTVAPGGSSWTSTVTNVSAGTNTLTVVAIDSLGNQSKPIFRNFFRRVQRTLDLAVTGQGTLTGPVNGEAVDLMRYYSFVAKPAPGYVFNQWSGGFAFAPTGARSRFVPNLLCYFYPEVAASLRAEFIPNPFLPTKGTYNGLFFEAGAASNDLSGFLTMAITDQGAYSGKVTVEGKTLPVSGKFSNDGRSTLNVVRNGTNNLSFQLLLDVTNGTAQVTGTVSLASAIGRPASFIADRAAYNLKTNPAPRIGQYTMALPGAPSSGSVPHGHGYATVKIDGNGGVTVAGALADGSKFTQKTALSKNDVWPLFGSPYGGKGLVLGWIDCVTNNPTTALLGDFIWRKLPAKGVYHTNGFVHSSAVIGSVFLKPASATTRVVDIPSGTISFTGGNLAPDFSNQVVIAPSSAVTSTNANKLTLTLNKSTGLMSGTVVRPSGGTALKYSGVILQNQSIGGYGFFLGTNQSGRVVLGAP